MFSIKQSHLAHITRRFWAFLLGSIIAFAVLVQIGRQAFLLIDDYRDVLAESLSDQLGVDVRIGAVNANWQGLRLELELSDVDIYSEAGVEIFTIGAAEAELSLIDSVIERGLAWRTIIFEDLTATFVQKENHIWKIKGYDGGTANTDNPFNFDDPLDVFLFGRRVEIISASFLLEFAGGTSTELSIPSISLDNDRFFHRMNAEIDVDGARTLTFVVEGYGDPRNRDNFSASGYLKLESVPLGEVTSAVLNDDIAQWVLPYIDLSELDFEFWFRGSPEAGMTASGNLSVSGISGQGKDFNVPQEIKSDLSAVWNSTFGWQLMLREPELLWEKDEIRFSDIGIFGRAGRTGLRITELNVEDLLLLTKPSSRSKDDKLSKILGDLNPRGILSDIELQLKSKEDGYFLARANVAGGAIDSIYGVPDLENINAYVEANLLGGYADIDVDSGTRIHLPKVFSEGFNLDSVEGQLSWKIDLENKTAFLESDELTGMQDGRSIRSVFAMELPFNRSIGEQKLSLIIEVDEADVMEYSTYLPNDVPEDLSNWLASSLKAGSASNIQVLYQGSVQKNPEFKPSYQVLLGFDKLDFRFDPQWPVIESASGHFLLNSNQVSGKIQTGKSLDNEIKSVEFETREFTQGFGVRVHADIVGTSNNAKRFVLNSPLQEVTKDFLPHWTMQGNYLASVDVDIPFTNKADDVNYKVSTTLENNNIIMNRLGLELEAVEGAFLFSKAGGLSSPSVDFELWGEKFNSKINSDNEFQDIHFDLEGELNTERFKEWAARPEFIFLDGNAKLDGQLKVPTSSESQLAGVVLNVESNLVGMAVQLPEPFYKSSESSLSESAMLKLEVVPDGVNYHYTHGDIFTVSTLVTEDSLPIVDMRVGQVKTEQVVDTIVASSGNVKITGSLEYADYALWSAALDRYIAESSKTQASTEAGDVVQVATNLNIDKFNFFDEIIPGLQVRASNQPDLSWEIIADADMVSGKVLLPTDESQAIAIHLRRLMLENEQAEADSSEITSSVSDFDLSSIGLFDVVIDQLTIDGVDWGNWKFKTLPIDHGLLFDELQAKVRELKIGQQTPSQFYWTKQDGQHQSRFVGEIIAADIGKALQAWEFEKLMESKEAKFQLDVSWGAEPDLVSLNALEGDVAFAIANGSFLRATEAGENPLLRLMALFNFDTFARRLRFDFSDLAAKGFAFDQVRSELSFERGTAVINQPLIVESSSSRMQMVGELDLVNEGIEAELVVTLPVAGNLAVAAAFAAGLPAGLGVYIISKMFDKQVDKASSISYSVSGSWVDPKLKVSKVFDNKTKRTKKHKSEADGDSMVAE